MSIKKMANFKPISFYIIYIILLKIKITLET